MSGEETTTNITGQNNQTVLRSNTVSHVNTVSNFPDTYSQTNFNRAINSVDKINESVMRVNNTIDQATQNL